MGRSSGFTNYYSGSNYVEAIYGYRTVNENETGQVQYLDYFKNGSSYGMSREYQYDVNGNITHIYSGEMLIVRYKYDGMSRLIREDSRYTNKTVVYSYDSDGNMVSKTDYALSFTDELGTPTDTVTSTYGSGIWRSMLLSYDGNADFRYDFGGNPTVYKGYSMNWEKGRQLAFLLNDELSVQFKYNQSGIRTRKSSQREQQATKENTHSAGRIILSAVFMNFKYIKSPLTYYYITDIIN